jgi:ferredoxin
MLCGICTNVLQHRANLISDEPGDEGPRIMCAHHRTTLTLENSATEGCHVCLAFWNQLFDAEKEALRVEESKATMNKEERKDDGEVLKEHKKDNEEPQCEEDYFEWLTLTILQRDEYCGGDYLLTVIFSGEGIDWEKVSARKDLALGLSVLREVAGTHFS